MRRSCLCACSPTKIKVIARRDGEQFWKCLTCKEVWNPENGAVMMIEDLTTDDWKKIDDLVKRKNT